MLPQGDFPLVILNCKAIVETIVPKFWGLNVPYNCYYKWWWFLTLMNRDVETKKRTWKRWFPSWPTSWRLATRTGWGTSRPSDKSICTSTSSLWTSWLYCSGSWSSVALRNSPPTWCTHCCLPWNSTVPQVRSTERGPALTPQPTVVCDETALYPR